jgi:transcriptional antiterminator NusG
MVDEVERAVFAVKTTVGQEKSCADMIANRARKGHGRIFAILSPEALRGYILVEAQSHEDVEIATHAIPHMKGVVDGSTPVDEIDHFLIPKPAVSGLSEGDLVELVAGPFRGEKARVIRIDSTKEEITVELMEALVPIPVTVRGDHVRVLKEVGS